LKNNRDCSLLDAVGVKGDCDKKRVRKDTYSAAGGGDGRIGDDGVGEDDEDGENDDDVKAAPRKTACFRRCLQCLCLPFLSPEFASYSSLKLFGLQFDQLHHLRLPR